jgi:tRNA(Ile)-lysidine synthase
MLPPGSRVVAAVSGGPDSVCLLRVLLELAPGLGITVAGVAHVNHKLRGEESAGDERFVAGLARQGGLPFHCLEAPAGQAGGNLEQAARRARREFFESLVRGGAATHVALGHTLDDQAETVLFRILRGSGPAGLTGILPVARAGIVHPLLEVTRAEAAAFLDSRGIPSRQDCSNLDPRFARNRIRRSLLPQLAREWNPQIARSLAHLAGIAWDEERHWDAHTTRLAAEILADSGGAVEIDVRELAPLPVAVVRRLLRHAVRTAKGDLNAVTYDHLERLTDLAASRAGSGEVDLPGLHATRSFDWIRIAAALGPFVLAEPRPVPAPGVYPSLSGDSLVHLEIVGAGGAGDGDAGDLVAGRGTLKLESCGRDLFSQLVLRGWQPGDRYRPEGRSRDRKLKEMFQQARVPSWCRPGWPILSNSHGIVWARQFGVAAEWAAAGGSLGSLRVWDAPVIR